MMAAQIDKELRQVLEGLPSGESRSKLEPYREFILRWRRLGWSYRRIRKVLEVEAKLGHVAVSTLHEFVGRRSRGKKADEGVVIEKKVGRPAGEMEGQRVLMNTLRDQPVVVAQTQKRFEYDPDKPLTIEQGGKKR